MLRTILLVFAFVLFVLSGFSIGVPRFNLIGLGLACWVLSIILGGVKV